MREMPVRMRNLCPRDDGVVAVSGGVAADTERLMDMPAGRVTAIFNPVYRPQILALADAAAPHPWLQTDSLPVVLGVGKMKPQKDFPTLLKAFALLRQEHPAKLIILGAAAGKEGLEALAETLGIRAAVPFPKYVPNPHTHFPQ